MFACRVKILGLKGTRYATQMETLYFLLFLFWGEISEGIWNTEGSKWGPTTQYFEALYSYIPVIRSLAGLRNSDTYV